jgi:hypothetical protein
MSKGVLQPGDTVWVGGHVQASGYVVEVLEERSIGPDGPVQLGRFRVKLDGTGDQIDVSGADIERQL